MIALSIKATSYPFLKPLSPPLVHLNTWRLDFTYTLPWQLQMLPCYHRPLHLIHMVIPAKKKAEVRPTFISFTTLVENRFNSWIGTLFSDSGGEFVALKSFLQSHGISHLASPPHTPQHNGIAERKHRHIVETGLSLHNHAGVPHIYWPYALATATYLINCMPTPTISLDSPFHKLFNQPPNYTKLRTFGCLCFPWLWPYSAHKLDARSVACVFLGYSLTHSAYLCLEPANRPNLHFSPCSIQWNNFSDFRHQRVMDSTRNIPSSSDCASQLSYYTRGPQLVSLPRSVAEKKFPGMWTFI